MFTLPVEERETRWNKVRAAMQERGLECLIIRGSSDMFRDVNGNLQYLTNVGNMGYLLFPLKTEPTLYTFGKGNDPLCWVKDWRVGHPAYSKVMSERIKELHLEKARIGMVGLSGYYGELGFSHSTYAGLVTNLPEAKFEDATDIVEDIRLIKSAAEIKCLEIAGEVGEKAIQAVVDTVRAGVKDLEIRAILSDAMFRNGGELGTMLLSCRGKEGISHAGQSGCYFEAPSSELVEKGDVILTEFDATYFGYKGQFAQPFSVGQPDKEWKALFDIAVEAFNNGTRALKPGLSASGLDEAMISTIKKAGYTCGYTSYHGVGLGLEEPCGSFPSQTGYKKRAEIIMQPNMVMKFRPHPVSLDSKRGVALGCNVMVTEKGCRLLAKAWKPGVKILN